jgi:hypothetical protein
MKKECTRYQSLVEPFLEGKLTGFERQSFVEHMKKCKICHEELEIYHVIYSVVDELNDDSGEETNNYMATLEKRLGTVSRKDAIFTNVKAAYGFIALGLISIAAGIVLLIM